MAAFLQACIKPRNMKNEKEASLIKEMLEAQAKAVQKQNIDEAVKNYAPDVLIYDVVGPLRHDKGVASVKQRLTQWFSTFAEGSAIGFELVDLSVSAGEDLAFSHSLNHVNAPLKAGGALDMFWRETLNWEKIDGVWKIVHAHSSVPFDPATGKASTGLKPPKSA
jgi:ketosteroid isomerase-like protein